LVAPSDATTSPEDLLRVANLTLPVKPVSSPRTRPDPFGSPGALSEGLGLERVDAADVDALRALHGVVIELVDRLLAGRAVASQVERLTQLAHGSRAGARLELRDDGSLRARLEWSDPDPASALARRLISELGALDVGRLRRCARPECDLVFYDTTRSGTRRWHAESPCGIRERQRRHRRRAGAGAAG
jgi:predicted RNA-binding Zn ribbon-like protein